MAGYWPHWLLLGFLLAYALIDWLKAGWINAFEETTLVVIMASIVLVSFGQVVARYGFNTGWAAALEFNTVAFSWLILFGMSYGLKQNLHLGVDIVLKHSPPWLAKALSLFAVLCCCLYALLLLDAAWLSLIGSEAKGGALSYWSKMYRVGIGSEELRYPAWFAEYFEIRPRVHRWLVLLILPMGLGLFLYRALQAGWGILRGHRASLIASHEGDR